MSLDYLLFDLTSNSNVVSFFIEVNLRGIVSTNVDCSVKGDQSYQRPATYRPDLIWSIAKYRAQLRRVRISASRIIMDYDTRGASSHNKGFRQRVSGVVPPFNCP